MKPLKTLSLSLLLGLSTYVFAEQAQVTPEPTTVAPQVTAQISVPSNKVNINTASAAELQDKLVGIGEKKAQSIVDYRAKNGNFTSIEQLAEVSGIGQAILEKNRNNLILE
ncbi:ComEA family DNA-binding protein [Mannheimia sp. AT1]|uniref:ComEA family DNA-binding protein n=1 Tax=Mannheimia cairinae TaxID=3025936 RepID=A0ABT5MMR1_9PAST|nr:ComEA family DNA-binding protein [Mannheimia cairinae]MDD0823473.1 ComEA family DNA-binding protein [Mannheimia cairinae]MDD0826919.1 ComEA family DNA-binding protein [Mannheimia cairinae]